MTDSITAKATTTARTFIGFLGLAAVLASTACGGGGDGRAEGESIVSCVNMSALETYRYSINVRLHSANKEDAARATSDPLDDFNTSLTALLSDFAIDGARVGPERTQVILAFREDEIELRQIGPTTWERVGGTWSQRAGKNEDAALLTPEVVCSDTVQALAASLERIDAQAAVVNEIEAIHYRLEEADIVLPSGVQAEVPSRYQVDLWLAKDGRWPLRLQVGDRETDEGFFMELRDINDPGISIEPPVASAPVN